MRANADSGTLETNNAADVALMSAAGLTLTFLDLLRFTPDLSEAIRLRIAIDVLADLASGGVSFADRTIAGLHVRSVIVAADGRARASEWGDRSGAGVLLWEIVAGREAGGPLSRLRDVVDEVRPDVDDLIARVVGPSSPEWTLDEVADELERAAGAGTATRAEVRSALEEAWRRSGSRDKPPEDELFDEDWDLGGEASRAAAAQPSPPPRSRLPSLVHMDEIHRRADERGAAIRASAEVLAAMRVEAEKVEVARAAEELKLLRADEERLAAESQARETRETQTAKATAALHEASTRTAELLAETLDPDSEHRRRTVLLIHGPDASGAALTRALEEANFEVIARQDGATALSVAAYLDPDCIVCDYDLPDASGDSIARRIRKTVSDLALTPFVLLASPTDTRAGLARFALGADVCMMKPARPKEVVAQVRALLAMVVRLRAARTALPALQKGRSRNLGGSLVQISIASLLTVIEMERRTGVFKVINGQTVARLEVASGALVAGGVGDLPMSPLGALRVMLTWKTGEFSFSTRPPAAPPEGAMAISQALTIAMKYEGAPPRTAGVPSEPPLALHGNAGGEPD